MSQVAQLESDLRDRLAHTSLADEPFFLAARLSALGSAAANRVLTDLGLKVRSYSVLAFACGDPKPTQRELSQFLVLDPSQIVALVDELEALGAVERHPDPRDRRSKIIVATASGRRLHRKAKQLVDEQARESLHRLDDRQRAQFLELLHVVAID